MTGSFQSGDEAKAVAAAVQKLVGVPKHVLSILGFVDTLPKLASETTPEDINNNWSNSLWPTIRSANAFVPLLKGKVRLKLFECGNSNTNDMFSFQFRLARPLRSCLAVWRTACLCRRCGAAR